MHDKITNIPRFGSYVCCLPHAHYEGILQQKVNFSVICDFHSDTEILAL